MRASESPFQSYKSKGILWMWSICAKIALIVKIFRKKKLQTPFCCLCDNLLLSKFWGNWTNFLCSWQCPLQVKKLMRENSVKYVNQTGNFNFRPKLKAAISLPISNLFQWFLFTWEISLGSSLKPKNRNLKKIAHLKVYSNLKQPHKLY